MGTYMINPNTGPVHVPDEEVDKRLSQGWTLKDEPKEEPKPKKKKDK